MLNIDYDLPVFTEKTGYRRTQGFLHQVISNVIFESCQNFMSKFKSENFETYRSYLYWPLYKIFFKAIRLTLAAKLG